MKKLDARYQATGNEITRLQRELRDHPESHRRNDAERTSRALLSSANSKIDRPRECSGSDHRFGKRTKPGEGSSRRNNRSFEAAEASKKWADKLNEWATKLEGEKDEGGGDGEGGDGAPDSEDEDFEFMLRVMKMIQQEQDLRARTRALEQLRRDHQKDDPDSNEP